MIPYRIINVLGSCFALVATGFGLMRFINRKLLDKKNSDLCNNKTKVIFFPDSKICCLVNLINPGVCLGETCKFTHEDTGFSQLIETLLLSRCTLDICVYTICSPELTDIVCLIHERGVRVRVITDGEMKVALHSQVSKFLKRGIPVRFDSSSFFMHHKFAVIDNKIVINGSFNWTRTAVVGNHENVMISFDEHLVNCFVVR